MFSESPELELVHGLLMGSRVHRKGRPKYKQRSERFVEAYSARNVVLTKTKDSAGVVT